MSREITEFPDRELQDDWYASKMEHDTYVRLGFPEDHERIGGNQKIMDVIEAELARRGKLHLIGKEQEDGDSAPSGS